MRKNIKTSSHMEIDFAPSERSLQDFFSFLFKQWNFIFWKKRKEKKRKEKERKNDNKKKGRDLFFTKRYSFLHFQIFFRAGHSPSLRRLSYLSTLPSLWKISSSSPFSCDST